MKALLALGSNLDNPVKQILNAVSMIGDQQGINILAQASLYSSSPRGPQDQDDYVNSAVLIETRLTPEELLYTTQAIENAMGRVKTRVWGERIIDIDIVFYAQQIIELSEPDLGIPHREALVRDFVLIPCLEIAPDWKLPDGSELKTYIDHCITHKLAKIDGNLACSSGNI